MNDAPWRRRGAGGSVTLTLHVQPGAKRTEVAGLHGDALKVRLAAPPVDGKANAELIAFVSGLLKIPRSSVALTSGVSSRRKVLRIEGADDAALDILAPPPEG